MTTSEAHEGRLLHTLQGPRHSSPLHRHKGFPIYREQSAIAMELWALPAGQEYTAYIEQLLILHTQYEYNHTHQGACTPAHIISQHG